MTFFLMALVVLVWVSVPVIVWFAMRQWAPKIVSVPLYAAIIAVLFFTYIVGSAMYQEQKVESDLVEFDFVHAGMELTENEKDERQQLFLKIIHDTGRTFAPITGAIGGFIYFILIWLSIYTITRVNNGMRDSTEKVAQ